MHLTDVAGENIRGTVAYAVRNRCAVRIAETGFTGELWGETLDAITLSTVARRKWQVANGLAHGCRGVFHALR